MGEVCKLALPNIVEAVILHVFALVLCHAFSLDFHVVSPAEVRNQKRIDLVDIAIVSGFTEVPGEQ